MNGASVADDANDDDTQLGEQFGQLPQRRIDYRTRFGTANPNDTDFVVGERDHVERAGNGKAPADRQRDFDFGRNDHVDRHVVSAEHAGPDRAQIALVTHAGNFHGNGK